MKKVEIWEDCNCGLSNCGDWNTVVSLKDTVKVFDSSDIVRHSKQDKKTKNQWIEDNWNNEDCCSNYDTDDWSEKFNKEVKNGFSN